MECIICDSENEAKSIEHIVPESFGNKHYVMPKGSICDACNNRFSKFEAKALSNSVFVMERARLGIKTKKGKNVKGKVHELEIKGDEKFKKDHITIKGLNKDNIREYNPETKTLKVHVKSFDKSEVASSKFLLMLGIESLYKSRPKVFSRYDFSDLKAYLKGESNNNWGFITARKEIDKFESVPRFTDKYRLNRINCKLRFQEIDENTLLFRFEINGISMIINLLGRDQEWIGAYKANEDHVSIYPEHLEKSYNKRVEWRKRNEKK